MPNILRPVSWQVARLSWFIALPVFLCAAPGFASAQAATATAQVRYLDKYVDRRSTETRVGGRPLVGAMLLPGDRAQIASPLVPLPERGVRTAAAICLETVTVDGSYWAQGEIPTRSLASDPAGVLVRYGEETRPENGREIENLLHGFDERSVAVLATVGGCQDDHSDEQIVVVRRGPGSPKVGVRLFINASRNQVDVGYSGEDGHARTATCRLISGERQRIAFDTLCDLEGPLPRNVSVSVSMTRFERKLPERKYRLLVEEATAATP